MFITIYNHKIWVHYLDFKTKNNPTAGDIVIVSSPTFNGFYRAEIKNVIDTDFYVSHIDFGSTEVVKLSNIFELSNELKKEVLIFLY